MSPRSPLLMLAATLAGLACTAPTYEELEAQRPRLCNAQHLCASGYACVDGVCLKEGQECRPGTQRPCGVTRGECRQGTQSCSEEGRFGPCAGEVLPTTEVCNNKDDDCDGDTDEGVAGAACGLTLGVCANARQACVAGTLEPVCTAASYGPDHEAVERRCDNKDNDCDGQTDEQLSRPCANQQGVCQGSTESCVAGAYGGCDEAGWRAHSAEYEPLELSCDNRDNDCDGRTDTWVPRNLSLSPSAASRQAAVGSLSDGTGTVYLVLYEDGARVLARPFGPQGPGAPSLPTATLSTVDRASLPAVASDGTTLAAAWVEQVGSTRRVMISPLNAQGRSTLPNQEAVQAFSSLPSALPRRLSLAVSGRYLAVAMQDEAVESTPAIHLAAFSLSASRDALTPLYTLTLSELSQASRLPHVSPADGGGLFNVVWEVVGRGISLKTVRPDGSVSRSLEGIGSPSLPREPHVFTQLSSGSTFLYYLVSGPTQDILRVSDCTQSTCTPGSTFLDVTGSVMADLSLLPPAPGELPTVALWTETGSATAVRYAARSSTGGSVAGTLTPAGESALRPVALIHSAGARRTLLSLFDTEGAGGPSLPAGELFLRPACLP